MPVPGHTVYHLYKWLWSGLDLLYPPQCGGCGKRGVRWCASCQVDSYLISSPICIRCGRVMDTEGVCENCFSSPPKFEALRSWAGFEGPVRNALHRLKYERDISLGEVLAQPLITCFLNTGWEIDLVVPVPLGVARQEERGYNQAALLALPLAITTGLDYQPNALKRIKETRTQVGLSIDQRQINVAGAFQANSRYAASKRVLLVDDVATSGATLDECASALQEAGANEVYGLTLARAL